MAAARPSPKRAPARESLAWLRPATVLPVVASLAVHAALLYSIERIRIEGPARLVDATDEGIDAVLVVAAAPQPRAPQVMAPPSPTPPPPPPPPREPPSEPASADPPVAKAGLLALFEAPSEPPAREVPLSTKPAPESARRGEPTKAAPAPPPASPPPRATSFAGVAAQRASRLVYAIDAGGAMTSSLPYVKEELLRSVSRLDESQRFQVLVFRTPPGEADPRVDAFEPGGFATPDTPTTARLATWLDTVQPRGRSQPLAGLRAALAQQPDLIFLLTRSIRRSGTDNTWGEGTQATLAELDRLNPPSIGGKRPTVIKALQFIDPDPTGMLQQIGALHGDGPSSYTVVRP